MDNQIITKDLRVAILGNVSSGKSTLVGVLSKGIKYNGDGYARSFVLKHDHERSKGQTSAISQQLIGYCNKIQIYPNKLSDKTVKNFNYVASRTTHRINLVDRCGHEKYLKTTVFGITGNKPHMVLLIVSANDGILKMTREHFTICLSLKIPIAIIVTKIDLAPSKILEDTNQKIFKILKKNRLRNYVIKNNEDSYNISKIVNNRGIVPIFYISNKTNEGIPLLRNFLSEFVYNYKEIQKINSSYLENDLENDCVYQIDSVYYVPGVGIVVGGIFEKGNKIEVGDKFMLGPFSNNDYVKITIKSIHSQCIPIDIVYKNQSFTLGLKFTKKNVLKSSKMIKG